jgi:hypothetical protein
MVDGQFAPMHDKLKAAIAALSPLPIKYLVNTHHHGDHTGGNAGFAADGAIVVAHINVRNYLAAGTTRTRASSLYQIAMGPRFRGDERCMSRATPLDHRSSASMAAFKYANDGADHEDCFGHHSPRWLFSFNRHRRSFFRSCPRKRASSLC